MTSSATETIKNGIWYDKSLHSPYVNKAWFKYLISVIMPLDTHRKLLRLLSELKSTLFQFLIIRILPYKSISVFLA